MPSGIAILILLTCFINGCKSASIRPEAQAMPTLKPSKSGELQPEESKNQPAYSIGVSSAKNPPEPINKDSTKKTQNKSEPRSGDSQAKLDCSEASICPSLLRPAVCSAIVKTIEKNIIASGMNECVARQKIRKKLCISGKNSDLFHIDCQLK